MDANPGKPHSSGLPKRYRLPGIERSGIVQNSLLETSLWPFDPDISETVYRPSYKFSRSKGGTREVAHVQIHSPLGLRDNDPYILWGLLGATLDRGESNELVATQYWMRNYLGLHHGKTDYVRFASALERIAMTGYMNQAFWNPLQEEYQRVAFNFFSTWLPTTDKQGSVDADRSWRIVWNPAFMELTRATGGSMLFDIDLLKRVKPTTRQLFLMLHSRFWRSHRVFMNVDDLTVNGMGMSARRELKKRKAALVISIKELLDAGVIRYGRGQSQPSDVVFRKSKGLFIATFFRGPYFEVPVSASTTRRQQNVTEDELYEPLKKIGLDEKMIRKAFKEIARGRIQQAVRITEMAIHEKPAGFPGFKKSPAAFCWHYMSSDYMPPDWMHAHEKKQEQQRWDRERAEVNQEEKQLRDAYQKARKDALVAFMRGDGEKHFREYYRPLEDLYRAQGNRNFVRLASDAAIDKIEREHFQYPEFAVWAMSQLQQN